MRNGVLLTLRAGDDATAAGCNIHARYGLVVALELILELEGVANLAVEIDGRIAGNGQSLVVSGEGVIRDWTVEKVVNFRGDHFDGY